MSLLYCGQCGKNLIETNECLECFGENNETSSN